MAAELKVFTINMKTLSQKIESPIVCGEGNADGYSLRVIFTQEAADQFTPDTKVYLKWYHQTKETRGYNLFCRKRSQESVSSPQVWEIKLPKMLLFKGTAICTLELVDDISVSATTPFWIYITGDAYGDKDAEASDDFTAFQNAVIDLNSALDKANSKFEDYETRFSGWEKTIDDCNSLSQYAYDLAQEAIERIDDIVSGGEDSGLYMHELD